jgi:hypothetical protein
MAHQKMLKLSGQIDLDEYSKSCHRLKVPGCCLSRDIGVTMGQNDPTFRSPLSEILRPIELNIFFTDTRHYLGCAFFFGFL